MFQKLGSRWPTRELKLDSPLATEGWGVREMPQALSLVHSSVSSKPLSFTHSPWHLQMELWSGFFSLPFLNTSSTMFHSNVNSPYPTLCHKGIWQSIHAAAYYAQDDSSGVKPSRSSYLNVTPEHTNQTYNSRSYWTRLQRPVLSHILHTAQPESQ